MSWNVWNPGPDHIFHFKSAYAGMRFEWHPKTKKVYLCREDLSDPSAPVIGDPIAFEVENHGQAWNYVLVWQRGFHEAMMIKEISNGRIPTPQSGRAEASLRRLDSAAGRYLGKIWSSATGKG